MEVLLSDDKVRAVLFNVFGGITRCDEVARGVLAALDRLEVKVPLVVRLDGTNDVEGRQILADAAPPNVHVEQTMLGAAARVVELAGRRRLMAILVDADTRLVVQGITGREGSFHALRNRDYGTAGRRRGHAGQGRPGRRRRARVRHRRGGGRRAGAPTRRWCSCRRASPPTRSTRRSTPASTTDRLHHRGHPRARDAADLQLPAAARASRCSGPTAPARSRRTLPTWASSPPRCSPEAGSGWSRARARSPTRSARSWRTAAWATRPSSASAATRSSAARSSTC